MYEITVESELKITNVPWNSNLSDSNSHAFIEMKIQVEKELDKAFCKKSIVENGVSKGCHVEVFGFSEGSVNVWFQINEVTELVGDNMPTDAQTLSNMQQSLALGGLGNYAVNQSSVTISK